MFASIFALLCAVHALPAKMFAGEVHFARIPFEYWEHRILMIKALGMNALSVYVMWNHHQARPGSFDFSTENKNLPLFLSLAAKHNMSVLLRPGPYVCAEWDFGGLPYWLIKQKEIAVRSSDEYFLNRSEIYINAISKVVKDYLAPKGPIVMIQIENEYGSWGSDKQYLNAILKMWKNSVGEFQYYHADGYGMLDSAHLPGLNIGINGCSNKDEYDKATAKYPDAKFIFGGEIYPGWLTHWGESSFQHQNKQNTYNLFKFFVDNNRSFSMYMVHGGTNFAFTNGVNSPLQVHVTSYDYDAPINEHGLNTPKYDMLRPLFKAAASWDVPQVPAPIPIGSLPTIVPKLFSTYNALGSFAPLKFVSQGNSTTGNWTFEQNDMPHGMISYKFKAPAGSHSIQFTYNDYAYLIVNKERVIFNAAKTKVASYKFSCLQECEVEIVVQSQGHTNYDHSMLNQRKGLKEIKSSFNITAMSYKLTPFFPEDLRTIPADNSTVSAGYVFKANFTLTKAQIMDTYLIVSPFTKGYLFVNGRNLGRYWNVGPQYRLYCPGVWLKETNQLIVFDEESKAWPIYSIDRLEN